jgi:hypothetical protein
MAQFQLSDDDPEAVYRQRIDGDYETYGGSETEHYSGGGESPFGGGENIFTPPKPTGTGTAKTRVSLPGYTPGTNSGISGNIDPTNWGDLFQQFQQSTNPYGDPENADAFIRNALNTVSYGASGLKSLKDPLAKYGYNVWTASDGGARGIITDKFGRDWNVLDPNESMNWWTNQTGTTWTPRIEQRGGGGPAGGGGAPAGGNDTLQGAIDKLTALFDKLQAPAMTDLQRAQARTRLQEPLEGQRAAAQERALLRASGRGLGLGSGVIEQEAQGIDEGFDRLMGEGFLGLALDELNRGDARTAQAANIANALADIGQFQSAQGSDLYKFNSLLPLQQLAGATNSMNSLGYLNAVPQQESLGGLISLMLGLSGQGQNAYNTEMGQDSNFWASLFRQLPGLMGAIPGLGGNGGYQDSLWFDDPIDMSDADPSEWYGGEIS